MAKTVTLRLSDEIYNLFVSLARQENRAISNFIETSVLRDIRNRQIIDPFEMEQILNDDKLQKSLKRAIAEI